MIKKVNFKYTLEGYGWADAELTVGSKKQEFRLSYLSAPLDDLMAALVCMLDDFQDSNKERSFWFTWHAEFYGWRWKIAKVRDEGIHILVKEFKDVEEHGKNYDDDPNHVVIFDEVIELNSFARAVAAEADKIIKKNGFIKYRELWDLNGGVEFPMTELLFLKHYILYGEPIDLEHWNPRKEAALIKAKV